MHWKTPTVMVAPLLAGLALALGHHFYYASLAGQVVDNGPYNQQWAVRFGTAFAFLVRAALVISVGAVCWQVFWSTVVRKRLSLSTLDSMSGMLHDLIALFDGSALRAGPLLAVLSLMAWLMPLAAVFPPATLTVIAVPFPAIELQNVSSIDFAHAQMATYAMSSPGDSPEITGFNPSYGNSDPRISRLALAVATQGQIALVPTWIHDSAFSLSYTSAFDAPAMQCRSLPSDVLNGFSAALNCNHEATTPLRTQCLVSALDTFDFMSWIPDPMNLVSFTAPDSMPGGLIPGDTNYYQAVADRLGLIVAYPTLRSNGSHLTYNATVGQDWNVLNCSLWNATYSVSFNFSRAASDIRVTDVQY